jgi:hypothetical protein
MQYPPAFHDDPEPHKGVKIVVFATTAGRAKRSLTEDDRTRMLRTEVDVSYPREEVELAMSQILEKEERLEELEVEVEVSTFYKDTLSRPSNRLKVCSGVTFL